LTALCLVLALGAARVGPGPVFTGTPALAPGLLARVQAVNDTWGSTRWRTGLAIISCRSDSLLVGWNAASPLEPASCQKLLVTTCALSSWDRSLVRELDSLLDQSPLRQHLHRVNRRRADSLGLSDHPEFPGYRHLVLANRESNNDEAEWMLHYLMRTRNLDAWTLLSRFLDLHRVPRKGLRVWDGCGLSHRNRVSALTLARLLARVHRWPEGPLFRSTLAVPGRPGTLVRRTLDVGPALAAKTGYIGGVFSLSGFLVAAADTYAFSFIINGCGSGTRAYQLFNGLLNCLYRWDREVIAPGGLRSGQPPRRG
jgi:D-alanyl-D-alanine carboxypeptidase